MSDDQNTDKVTDDQKVDDQKTGDQNAGDQKTGGESRTFTQEDLDKIVEERLARERKKFADYDDLSEKAARLDEVEAEKIAAIDEAIARTRREVTDELTAQFNLERVADRIEVAATGKFEDVEDARLRLGPRAEEFVSGGEVDTEAIGKAVDEVLANYPHLAAKNDIPSRERAGIGTAQPAAKPNVAPGYDRIAHAYAQKSD